MNKAEYRKRLLALHPDQNGGDHSRVNEMMELQASWHERNTHCAGDCGKVLSVAQVRRGGTFCGKQCSNISTNSKKTKPKKLKRNL